MKRNSNLEGRVVRRKRIQMRLFSRKPRRDQSRWRLKNPCQLLRLWLRLLHNLRLQRYWSPVWKRRSHRTRRNSISLHLQLWQLLLRNHNKQPTAKLQWLIKVKSSLRVLLLLLQLLRVRTLRSTCEKTRKNKLARNDTKSRKSRKHQLVTSNRTTLRNSSFKALSMTSSRHGSRSTGSNEKTGLLPRLACTLRSTSRDSSQACSLTT